MRFMKISKYLDFKMGFYYNKVVIEDMQRLSSVINIDKLKNNTIMITGATGMLATYMVFFLSYINRNFHTDIRIIAVCRNKKKADILFSDFYNEQWFCLINQDVCDEIKYEGNIDYIVHLASNANPYHIKNNPVDIIKSNIIGSINILEYSRSKKIKKVLFTSTREIYGKNEEKDFLTEKDYGIVDPLEMRACYPESKRAAETIFQAYNVQYGIPFNIVRIAHSYGPGMNLDNDGRVMADLMSNAVNGENIIVRSDGMAERAFCYITDTISAMFLILIDGEVNKPYNIANEKEVVSIKNLAEQLAQLSNTDVIFDIPTIKSNAYCNYKRSGLDTKELEKCGWTPMVSLKQGLELTYKSFKQ